LTFAFCLFIFVLSTKPKAAMEDYVKKFEAHLKTLEDMRSGMAKDCAEMAALVGTLEVEEDDVYWTVTASYGGEPYEVQLIRLTPEGVVTEEGETVAYGSADSDQLFWVYERLCEALKEKKN
jgi:hypothetical protein